MSIKRLGDLIRLTVVVLSVFCLVFAVMAGRRGDGFGALLCGGAAVISALTAVDGL